MFVLFFGPSITDVYLMRYVGNAVLENIAKDITLFFNDTVVIIYFVNFGVCWWPYPPATFLQ